MKSHKIKYLYVFSMVFLFSCTIEKRVYMNGYYISSAKTAKDKAPEKTPAADRLFEPVAEIVQDAPVHKTDILLAHHIASRTTAPETASTPLPVEQGAKPTYISEKKVPAPPPYPQRSGDEPIKDDVKKLLIAALGTLALSLVYCVATATGIAFLSKLLFILIPFSIIGVWIFALMLRTKYSYEEPVKSDKPSEKKKIYSKKKAFLLAGFLGIFGAHRFYLGYTDVGIFQMFTLGGFFVYYFIDMLMIKYGKLKPKNGDYGVEDPNYKQNRKKSAPNNSQKLIKIALLISLLALVTMLGSAIFLL